MELQNFQTAELRDENNNIIQEGAYGRKTPLTTGDNQGWIDFVMNNLEWLKDNGITVNQIATQAEAESGTINTKVMTPLRVENRVEKVFVFDNTNATIGDLKAFIKDKAIKPNAVIRFSSNNDWLTNWVNADDALIASGQIWTIRFLSASGARYFTIQACTYFSSGSNALIASTYITSHYEGYGNNGWGDWIRVLNENSFSTQAQAEAGTDNTTVMTPLRTKNAIEADRKMKTYGNLTKWNLSVTTVTPQDLYDNLPDYSTILMYCDATFVGLEIPANGVLEIVKRASDNTPMYFTIRGRNKRKTWVASFVNGDTPQWSGWKQLATNGALSMPSDTVLHTNFEKTGDVYTAPCDGWLYAILRKGSGTSFQAGFEINGGSFWHYLNADVNEWDFLVPMKKGDYATLQLLNQGNTITTQRFFCSQSEV